MTLRFRRRGRGLPAGDGEGATSRGAGASSWLRVIGGIVVLAAGWVAACESDPPRSTDDDEEATTRGPPVSPGNDESGFEPADAECGNGYVEVDEQCDDGNDVDDDGCSNACLVPCGLDVSTLVLPPTEASTIAAAGLVHTDDGVIVLGSEREVVTDQEGNEMPGLLVALVIRYDEALDVRWQARWGVADVDLTPVAVAATADGQVFVAGNFATEDGGTDLRVARFAADDGELEWEHTFGSDIDESEDFASGLALAPDGGVVVSGQVRAGDGDDDVWVRKLDPESGDPVWTQTWSGEGTDRFSTDDGGPVAVRSDGTVLVLAAEYVDFETKPPVLLRFDADAVEDPLVSAVPVEPNPLEYRAIDLALDPDDNAVLAYGYDGVEGPEYAVAWLDADGEVVWSRTREMLVDFGQTSDLAGVAAASPGALVMGGVIDDASRGAEHTEIWITRLDPAGEPACELVYGAPSEGLLPPSLSPSDAVGDPAGAGLVVASQDDQGAASLWLGRFRGPQEVM